MNRRVWRGLGVAGGAAALLGGVVAAAYPSSAAQTLTYEAKNQENLVVPVNGGGGFNPADQRIKFETLTPQGQSGATGYDQWSCTLVRVDPDNAHRYNCVINFALQGGQLTAQAVFRDGYDHVDGAIVGGTGDYTGASGTAHEVLQTHAHPNPYWTITLQ